MSITPVRAYLGFAALIGANYAGRVMVHDCMKLKDDTTLGPLGVVARIPVIAAHGVCSFVCGAAYAPFVAIAWINEAWDNSRS